MALLTISALRVPGPLSPRNASYRISASLDEDKKTITGRAHLSWRNLAAVPARELVFHLYMNAFKNESSTFLRESTGVHRRSRMPPHGWGAIDVTRLQVAGADLLRQLAVDDTLGTVPLPTPIAPGATVEVELEWTTQLPKVFARTGWHDDFFAVAQWFPKIAVFDGRWRAHQHHLNSEFFADFGVYDVELDLPSRFVVAATGVPAEAPPPRAAGRQSLAFHAEDVHDFAFAACPRFRPVEKELRGVSVTLYSLPEHQASVPRHFAALSTGLDELERRLGPYPYTRLSVIDVPAGAEGAGGMEYPTLFFTLDLPAPSGVHLPELVTMHELAHQYFQGIVASDEVEEAWLDEGLAETMTDLGLSRLFGRERAVYDFGGHHLSVTEMERLGYRSSAIIDPLDRYAFDYLSYTSYGAISYSKTSVIMRTVERLIGPERFERGLRAYYDAWRFRHPRAADFVAAFDAGAGEDLGWFWQPAIYGTGVVDYEVLSVEARRRPRPAGLFEVDGGARKEVEPKGEAGAPFSSEVVVHRVGDFALPVEVEVSFADGTTRREQWDGGRGDGARWRRFRYDAEATEARVDPWPLDVKRWNDGRRARPDAGPRNRTAAGWQLALSTILSAVGF
jgi:hypothetical protein